MKNMNTLSLLHGKPIVTQTPRTVFRASEHCVRLKVSIDTVVCNYSITTQ